MVWRYLNIWTSRSEKTATHSVSRRGGAARKDAPNPHCTGASDIQYSYRTIDCANYLRFCPSLREHVTWKHHGVPQRIKTPEAPLIFSIGFITQEL